MTAEAEVDRLGLVAADLLEHDSGLATPHDLLLSTAPLDARGRYPIWIALILSIGLFLALAPFAKTVLPAMPAITPRFMPQRSRPSGCSALPRESCCGGAATARRSTCGSSS